MNLTPAEKETIILTSEADETASVYTYDFRLKKKLRILSKQFPHLITDFHETQDGCVNCIIPKSCIVIYPPHSDKWRNAVTERAKTKGFHAKTDEK